MLQADIAELVQRQKILEGEIAEALSRTARDDLMVVDLKCRILFVREQIEILREQARGWPH